MRSIRTFERPTSATRHVALYLVALPVTGAALNPARALTAAVFVRGLALEQVWLLASAPLAGAVVGALLHRVAFFLELGEFNVTFLASPDLAPQQDAEHERSEDAGRLRHRP